jgi:GPN-loop GTPase
MEYLMKNIEWLDEELGETEDDFIIFDCPGQIELYNSHPALGQLTEHLARTQGFHLCGIYMLDAQFIEDTPKFFAGALSAMSAMVALEITHINILSKMDLVHHSERDLER